MWFKRKGKEDKQTRELRKEVQRLRKLLKAYDSLLKGGEVKPQMKGIAKHQRKIVLQLLSIADDFETAQLTLAFLWDSFEYVIKGDEFEEKPVIPGFDYYLNKLKNLEVLQCYNCLNHFRKAEHVCPNCGTSIQWLIP